MKNQPYLQTKGELEAEERGRYELDVAQSLGKSEEDNEIHEFFTAQAGDMIIRQPGQELQGKRFQANLILRQSGRDACLVGHEQCACMNR